MTEMLEQILRECAPYTKQGKLADYIPELTKANPNDFGICIILNDKKFSMAGDYQKKFTIQSVVKPILLLQALIDNGINCVKDHIGVEATGKPFDAINYNDKSLLSENINPMVNVGAIAMCTLIKGESYNEKFNRLLDLTRKLANNPNIKLDQEVYLSEKRTGNKNRANYVNAILITCGMYDGSGEFAVKVGVPAKSGVGGGIMAVVPSRMGIGIFSPTIDNKGNSVAGIKALEKLSKELNLSIF